MSPVLNNTILVALGLLPSIIWLSFYLRKDCHPEPKNLLARTFLMGIIIAPLAIFLQLGFIQIGSKLSISILAQDSPSFFLWAALIEELVKFYVVVLVVLRSPDFNEPVDAMIYMIVAALGFAAIENILVMFRVIPDGLSATLSIWALRFTGATLLHALSSGILGYFLAMSWFFQQHRSKLVIVGITIATLFHFTFNTFLSSFSNHMIGLIYSIFLLIIMAVFTSILFTKVKVRHIQSTASLVKYSGGQINLLK